MYSGGGEAGVTEHVVVTHAALVTLPHNRTHMTFGTSHAQVSIILLRTRQSSISSLCYAHDGSEVLSAQRTA